MTFIAVDGDRILGFATVAPRHIDIEDLPDRIRKKLPGYPVPALGLARCRRTAPSFRAEARIADG